MNRACAFHLVQCQVHSKDRLTMTTQSPEREFLDQSWNLKKCYVRYGALDGLDVSIDGLDIPLFFYIRYFRRKHISFCRGCYESFF